MVGHLRCQPVGHLRCQPGNRGSVVVRQTEYDWLWQSFKDWWGHGVPMAVLRQKLVLASELVVGLCNLWFTVLLLDCRSALCVTI
jgi:hypothetical protein